MITAEHIIRRFQMLAHPEGGFFCEIYRSADSIAAAALPEGYAGARSYATSILYLLRKGEYSHLHRIRQDEIWHFHLGGPLRLVTLSPQGEEDELILGPDIEAGHHVQGVVFGGSWFGATPAPGSDWTLVGCTVAPGFDFADFELARQDALVQAFPRSTALIHEFCS